MSPRMVVYHDGLLDLHLNVKIDVTVIVEDFAGPNATGSNTAGGAEDELPLSTNLGSLCNRTKWNTCQRQMWSYSRNVLTVNVNEKPLAHDPNNHESKRSAGGLRRMKLGQG